MSVPTIVLVHGNFLEPWSWSDVGAKLHDTSCGDQLDPVWPPVRLDDTVKVRRDKALQHRAGALGNGVQILEKHLRSLGSDGRHLLGRVTVAGVRRIRVEPEAGSPVATDPELVGTEQLGDVMVLHAGEVPHQPRDRVRVRRRSFGQPVEVDPDDGVPRGAEDGIVPPDQSRAVAAAAGGPTVLVAVRGADHNDRALLDGAVLIRAVIELADIADRR